MAVFCLSVFAEVTACLFFISVTVITAGCTPFPVTAVTAGLAVCDTSCETETSVNADVSGRSVTQTVVTLTLSFPDRIFSLFLPEKILTLKITHAHAAIAAIYFIILNLLYSTTLTDSSY